MFSASSPDASSGPEPSPAESTSSTGSSRLSSRNDFIKSGRGEDDYKEFRARNNLASKNCRERGKKKTQELQEKLARLRESKEEYTKKNHDLERENHDLERKNNDLERENQELASVILTSLGLQPL